MVININKSLTWVRYKWTECGKLLLTFTSGKYETLLILVLMSMEHDITHKSMNLRSRVLNRIFTRQREAVTEGGTKVHSEQQKK